MLDKPDLLKIIEAEGFEPIKRGSRWWLVCPFHDDRKPSLVIDKDKQVWFCHGCRTDGDVITFIQKLHGLVFPEACRYLGLEDLQKRPGIAKSKTQPKTPEEELREEFERLLELRKEVIFKAAFEQWLENRLGFLDNIINKLEHTLKAIPETSSSFDMLYLDLQKWEAERAILREGSLSEKLVIAEIDPQWRLVLLYLKQRSKK